MRVRVGPEVRRTAKAIPIGDLMFLSDAMPARELAKMLVLTLAESFASV